MYLKNDKDKEIRQLSPVERLLRVSSIQETDLPLIGSEDHDQIVEEHLSVQESVCKFVEPSKTLAIAFRHRFQKNVRHALAFTYSAITILSSARTVELYSSGDYVGTFRGDPLPGNPDSLASSTFNNRMKPQLFRIKVNEDYPRKCRDLLFKVTEKKKKKKKKTLGNILAVNSKILHSSVFCPQIARFKS
ncbi:hypothetical protein BCR41DRAFT_163787 [Lobosporangium transversale]|uniref:Uncharacterized protein n=1 Tax=Lobosporangium transversale TaxID=64571 RepID=A0A1Y2GCI5_9FUNG|nr:hypothetical protein BCR41DRAFT_163787 [Lobosporangium transversale]ORZ07020.1 hypothetical protein BCR41DRAFT_163787 [Lobosporangium transversale]|eukprot:XP_021877816.1 hypothetical protein BCR41DRAFT_163787 [Lobosporangium transversale]